MLFRSNDTATTEIYTPRHTLSLHDALQIFLSAFKSPQSFVTAAEFVAEIGDCRARYPTRESLSADGGQSAVAVESGKRKVARFRYACNGRLRQSFCVLADSSRHHNPWAQALYASALAAGHDHQRAIRTLGRAWSRIVWRCWQDGVPYELARHRAAQQYITVTIPSPSGDCVDAAATQRMAGDALDPSLDAGADQGSPRAAQPSPPKQRSGGGQSKAARQGRAKRAA